MRHRLPASLVGAAAMAAVLLIPAAAQQARRPQVKAPKGWVAPKTPDGVPDLQGVWSNATVTPLQRPANLANKEFYTEAEAQAIELDTVTRAKAETRGANAAADLGAAYNAFWYDRGNQVVPTLRTSLIIDPPDGRIPALTDEGRRLQAERAAERRTHGPADGPESRALAERCVVWGNAGPPMVSSFYNNNYQIVQGPGYVAILVEMIHDVRIIPTDGRAHLPATTRAWMGDPVGHWEGDTLVVETTNFRPETGYQGSSENMKLTERFKRVSNDVLMYEFTVNDPAFTRAWTAQIPMSPGDGKVFEYACNEGNIGMVGMLAGAREDEKATGRSR